MPEASNQRATVVRRPLGQPVLSARNLTKRYGEVLAVEALTFALGPGTITGFLGPNGAGKTTTLRLLLGLAQPTAGEALILGRRYQDLENPIHRVGAVLESGDFDPGRSGRNHLRVLALAAGIPFDRVEELLVLDEPANGLDPAGVHWLRGFLRQFAESGRTVLVSSHVLAEVAQTVDAVVIINCGRLAATVELDDLDDGARSLEDLYLELTARQPA